MLSSAASAPPEQSQAGLDWPVVTRVYHSAVVGNWRARDRSLRADGADVVLISAARWDEGGKEVTCEVEEDDFVLAVATIGSHPNLFLYDPRPIWRCLRLRPIDILDVHEEPCSLAAAELRLLRRLLCPSAKLVLYSAQNIFKRYPWPIRLLERGALRAASGAYVCNRRAGDILRQKGFRGRISVLPLGVDIECFAPDFPGGGSDGPGLRLGYVGRLEEHKGVQVVIEAMRGYGSWSLEIVGEGPYRQALMQQVRSAMLASQVNQRGFVPHHELPRLYRSFDVLVVPSLPTAAWEEQFCRVAVEAMASGVPVVASASGALPEVLGDGGLLFRPGDVSQLRDVLRRLESDRELRRTLVEAGLLRARQFSWKAVASRHRELYEEVLT